jgi:GNAT superfamily N-acetyltransferase
VENTDSDELPNAYSVRPATSEDNFTIQLIERRAGERFREVGLPEVADDEPEPVSTLNDFAADGRSFVSLDESGDLVGYVLVERIDGAAFVHQVSVLPEHQGRGVGRRLLDMVDAWARERRLTSMTLTTFDRHVPWNRPLYEHLGFRVMEPNECGPGLEAVQAAEAARGLRHRVAMIRSVTPAEA